METTLDFKCPNCNREMENGSIATANNINWIETKGKSSLFDFLNYDELVSDTTAFRWQTNKVNALRCPHCHIVTFKY